MPTYKKTIHVKNLLSSTYFYLDILNHYLFLLQKCPELQVQLKYKSWGWPHYTHSDNVKNKAYFFIWMNSFSLLSTSNYLEKKYTVVPK